MQTMGDEVFGHGLHSYIKATFADELTDDLIDVLVRATSLGSPLSQVEVLSLGGAIARVPAEATAFPHRAARWLLNIPASWVDPADTEQEVAWVRDTFAAIQPYASGRGVRELHGGRRRGRGRDGVREHARQAAARSRRRTTHRTCST